MKFVNPLTQIIEVPRTILRNSFFLVPLALFCLLLFRNPFSIRTLIPNLEPYPDTLHYINPALNLMHGNGLYLFRGFGKQLPSVPPLYSLTLIPGFIFHQDVRMFYLTNITLSLISFYLFYRICEKITGSRYIQFVCLFLYATCSLLYWYPELAMAENLTIPLFLLSVLLLLAKQIKPHTIVLSVALAVAVYATKFASLPLSATLILLSLYKYTIRVGSHQRLRNIGIFVVSALVFGGMYVAYELMVRNNNIIIGLLSMFWGMFSPKSITDAIAGHPGGDQFFSLGFAKTNLLTYSHWLVGDAMTVLWAKIQILPKPFAYLAVLGVVSSFFSKKAWIGVVLFACVISTIFFMMIFYTADGRYLIIAVPVLFLGFGLFLDWLRQNLSVPKPIFIGVIIVLFLVYLGMSIGRLKYDIMLNLRHSETPWYYLSVETLNQQLSSDSSTTTKTPIIISPMPPYFIDFYLKYPAILLPLSGAQEFPGHKQEAWGDHDYNHLPQVYRQYFLQGYPVYLSTYGLGNEKNLQNAFYGLLRTFDFEQVSNGCFGQCAVYRLQSLNPPSGQDIKIKVGTNTLSQ